MLHADQRKTKNPNNPNTLPPTNNPNPHPRSTTTMITMSEQVEKRKDVIDNCRKTYNALTRLIKTVTNYTIKEDLRDMQAQIREIAFVVKHMEA